VLLKDMPKDIETKKGTCSKLYNAVKKYGIDKFSIEILEDDIDTEDLDGWEMEYIDLYDSVKKGYNMKSGGDRSDHSEETKQIISERTKVGITNNIDNFRKHPEVVGLPKYIVWIKDPKRLGYAINKHPLCKKKIFTVKYYGTKEEAKIACLEYFETLVDM
jgi:hypothetical protein